MIGGLLCKEECSRAGWNTLSAGVCPSMSHRLLRTKPQVAAKDARSARGMGSALPAPVRGNGRKMASSGVGRWGVRGRGPGSSAAGRLSTGEKAFVPRTGPAAPARDRRSPGLPPPARAGERVVLRGPGHWTIGRPSMTCDPGFPRVEGDASWWFLRLGRRARILRAKGVPVPAAYLLLPRFRG